ncbi:MAG: hypothetical protein AB7T10_08220 [bacterium]
MDTILNTKKEKSKLTPEQLFQIYTECNLPNAPVKQILKKHNLKPWDLVIIRKKVQSAALSALAQRGKPGRKQQLVPVEELEKVNQELQNTKDALAAVGHKLSLLKKKSGLNLKGHLKGHFSNEVKQKVVTAIKESIDNGLTQKESCSIIDIDTRKYRRWANPKPLKPRTAWNKILPQERDAVINTAWDERFWNKPISHIFVYGHESGRFFMSLSSVYRILKSQKLVKE